MLVIYFDYVTIYYANLLCLHLCLKAGLVTITSSPLFFLFCTLAVTRGHRDRPLQVTLLLRLPGVELEKGTNPVDGGGTVKGLIFHAPISRSDCHSRWVEWGGRNNRKKSITLERPEETILNINYPKE